VATCSIACPSESHRTQVAFKIFCCLSSRYTRYWCMCLLIAPPRPRVHMRIVEHDALSQQRLLRKNICLASTSCAVTNPDEKFIPYSQPSSRAHISALARREGSSCHAGTGGPDRHPRRLGDGGGDAPSAGERPAPVRCRAPVNGQHVVEDEDVALAPGVSPAFLAQHSPDCG
jgi:hypothetical protein